MVLTILIGMECDRKHKLAANLCFQDLKNILNMDFKENTNFSLDVRKGNWK